MIRNSLQGNVPKNAIRSDAEKARICAANNADLYQAVFHSHGLPDQRNNAFWSSDAIAPPYYSNMTTLNPDATEEQLVEIGRLTDRLGRRPGLKDGFSKLELGDKGFQLLFSASWIWAEPHGISASAPQEWARIRDAAALDCWEHSWKESGSPTDANVFTPALLSDPDMHIYGRSAGGGFDAGCIVNRSPEAVGISNIFSLTGTPQAFRDAVSLAAVAFSPDLPLVGYDSGAALDEMTKLGFKSVGQLRIWLSDNGS
ncbi:hypothetical protein HGO34_27810 [Agrobacterium vitis]|uniref:Uncharacterized protein n=1 Tax=Agrobacterium vitis TaxID=373 RepID=A0AAE5AYS9_AGRVI|nr:hypothetical protein [Agrobacterium vitis]MCF1502044.1 hypothetical protein [Allorhizobium sp. Av2]MCM2443496.1 hypothetical protein [Agrobacterium vitis]MUZ61089.1 hypothetical protein [Agrobacterium vitis]MVA69406.1 hypothetical protein [Agrobacterium vitis]MVA90376.1 hypothetical protein [Agrobacterium vitis]